MHRERMFARGAAAAVLACALTIPAITQEGLKNPPPDRPRDRRPDSVQQRFQDRAKERQDHAKSREIFDYMKFFGDAVTSLEKNYVTKPDPRKLMEAAVRGMRKEFDTQSGDQAQERPDPDKSREPFDHFRFFADAVASLEKSNVVKPDNRKLIAAAIRGMLRELDAESEYIDPQEFVELLGRPKRELGGLGLHFRMDSGRVKVLVPGGPAEREGLGAGDLITHIDGKDLNGFAVDEVHRLLAGPPGSIVRLKVVPEGRGQPREVELQREIIRNPPSVQSSAELDVGYIRISAFREGTDTELTNAVQRLKREIAGKLKGYVIDLRNNTGGLLDQAVRSADVFLDSGLIVELRGPDQSDRRNALPGDAARGLPLVVLVNGGTAAGAEIMASALQDHQRARLLGSRTAGSGTVQTILLFGSPLVKGQSQGAMKLTTHRHYTPLGRVLEGVGVEPDVPVTRAGSEGPAGFVPPDKSRDAQLQRALSLLRDRV